MLLHGILCTFIFFRTIFCNAVHEEFLKDTKYSIQCLRDDGALTLVDTNIESEKAVILEHWQGKKAQQWFVENFQSLGRYEISPMETNSSATNPITYEDTKNVYNFKRQWKINRIAIEKYRIKNSDSNMCLTGMGLHEEVQETFCEDDFVTSQLWKLRILRRKD